MRTAIVTLILSLTLHAQAKVDSHAAKSDSKLVMKTSGVIFQVHQIFSEAWRLLIGVSEGSGGSVLKTVSLRLKQDRIRQINLNTGTKVVLETDKGSKLAEIQWNLEQTQFELLAWPSQLPEVVGESVVLLNQQLSCKGSVSAESKLLEVTCDNLSQGVTKSEHIAFKEFHYSEKDSNMLSVKADRYENLMIKKLCESADPCLQLQVPLAGNIHIVEDRRIAKKPVAPVMLAAGPALAIKPVKLDARKAQSETNLDDKNNIQNQEQQQEQQVEVSEDLKKQGWDPNEIQSFSENQTQVTQIRDTREASALQPEVGQEGPPVQSSGDIGQDVLPEPVTR